MPAKVSRWAQGRAPELHEIQEWLRAEGLAGYRWENDGGFMYGAHRHPYHKVLYCLRGSIRFVLPTEGESVMLEAGDRLELPAGTEHSAVVGPAGVACFEAQRLDE